MTIEQMARKVWWRKKKIGWTTRIVRTVGRSRRVTMFAGLVAVAGGARGLRRRLSHG